MDLAEGALGATASAPRLRATLPRRPPTGAPVPSIRSAMWTGLAGSAVIACAAMDGGALLRPVGGGWPVPLPRIPGGPAVLPVLLAHFGGLVLLARAWLALRRARPATATTVAVAALWAVPLLLGPPIASRDAYSYVAQGEIAAAGLDPYVDTAADLPAGPVRAAVDPLWRETPTPYGPVFVRLSEVVASLPGSQPFVGVLGVRVLALAGLGLLAWGVPVLARALGRDGDDALVLVLTNPLTLLHLVGGAHNEALLAGLVVAGFAAAATGRRWTGVALTALGGAVKLPALAATVVLAWGAPAGVSWRRRVRVLLGAVVVAGAVLVAMSWATGLGTGWTRTAGANGGAVSWAAPTTWLGAGVGSGPARLIAMGLAGTLATQVLASARRADAAVAGRILVIAAVAGAAVHPWYLLWGLPLLAAARGGDRCRLLAGTSILAAFAAHPGGGVWFEAVLDVDPRWVAAVAASLLAVLVARRPLTPPTSLVSHPVGGGRCI